MCVYTHIYVCIYTHTHTYMDLELNFSLGHSLLSIFRDKGELRGGEVPEQSRRFSLGIRQEVFHGSVTSMQLLQNPDDHMVHSERLPSSQNPSLLGPDVTLKSTSSRLLFYKWGNWDPDKRSDWLSSCVCTRLSGNQTRLSSLPALCSL